VYVTFKNLGRLSRSSQNPGLGNELFQIASTIGVARRNGCEFVFPDWDRSDCFAHPLPQLPRESLLECRELREESREYRELAITGPTSLEGYFQSERYFLHCADEVRHYFTPHPDLLERLWRDYGDELGLGPCSLHVRRGDYLDSRGYFTLPQNYYDYTMSRFDGSTRFLVFSDDPEWCRSAIRGNCRIIAGQPDFLDLFLMAQCRHHIVANSSFSWWGAWLNPRPDKIVWAPGRWFAGKKESRDRVPESWQRYDAPSLAEKSWMPNR
jgi:hypothetical protein